MPACAPTGVALQIWRPIGVKEVVACLIHIVIPPDEVANNGKMGEVFGPSPPFANLGDRPTTILGQPLTATATQTVGPVSVWVLIDID